MHNIRSNAREPQAATDLHIYVVCVCCVRARRERHVGALIVRFGSPVWRNLFIRITANVRARVVNMPRHPKRVHLLSGELCAPPLSGRAASRVLVSKHKTGIARDVDVNICCGAFSGAHFSVRFVRTRSACVLNSRPAFGHFRWIWFVGAAHRFDAHSVPSTPRHDNVSPCARRSFQLIAPAHTDESLSYSYVTYVCEIA